MKSLLNCNAAISVKGAQVTQIVDAIAAVQSGAIYLDKKVWRVLNQLKQNLLTFLPLS
jgi:hypothetical protein